MEDLEDDPILSKWCEGASSHRSRASTDTFSVSSRSSTLDNLMEDLGSLNTLFREHCDTVEREVSAIHMFEKAQQARVPKLQDMDVDDLSLASFDHLDEGGTRSAALSIDTS